MKVANAPCSWGIIENIEGDASTFDKVLDEMQATGYIGTELGDWGFMPTDPQQLTVELKQRDLQLLASWVSVYLHDQSKHEQSLNDCLRTGKLMADVAGSDVVVVLGNDPYTDPVRTKNSGRITPDMAMDDDTWKIFAEGANMIAERVRQELGIRTVFHHHIGTWVETPAEVQQLMDMTDPSLLGLVFDTGHYTFAGGDALEGVRTFADRIWHVHFKDCDQDVAAESRVQGWDGPESVGQGVFCELGQGGVDFPGVISVLNEVGYDGWIVVEQDVLPGMGTPRESAQRNRDYLASIGL